MLQLIQSSMAKIPKAAQYLLLAVAGVASFLAANFWASQRASGLADVELHVSSPHRSLDTQNTHAVDNFPTPLASNAPVPAPTRLGMGVLRNPFGPLNVLASVNQSTPDAGAALVDVSAQAAPKKKPKVPTVLPVVAVAQATPIPLPPPTAPPLPFIAVGSIQGPQVTDGATVAFLQYRGELVVVRVGDEINNLYRVDKISANAIDFTYLPLKTIQRLPVAQ